MGSDPDIAALPVQAASPAQASAPLLVHVGFHKAASTWLQRAVFGAAGGPFAMAMSLVESTDAIVRPHELEWDEASTRRVLDARLEAARAGGRLPVLSNEEFSGNPHAGGFASAELASRLARLAPEARILVVVRRQPDILVSTYKQFVRRGGTASVRGYFRPDPGHFRFRRFRAAQWEYDRLVARYHALFGAARVLVLPYEDLVADPAGFVGAVARFAGARPPSDGAGLARVEHASMSALAAALQRPLNRIFLRDDVNPGAPFHAGRLVRAVGWLDRRALRHASGPWDRALRTEVDRVAAGRYEESNARLAALTGLDLAARGYLLPSR